jgi:hypothetical protein
METLLDYQNRRRFTTKTKYYQYWVQNDHFDLVLVKTWGSLTSKRGNQQSIPIQFSDLPSYCANIENTRYSHGYLPFLCVGIEKTRQASGYSPNG